MEIPIGLQLSMRWSFNHNVIFFFGFFPIQLNHRSSYIWIERCCHLQIRGHSHTFCLYYPCHSTRYFPLHRLLFHSITITFKGQMWAKCPVFGVCSFQVSAHSRGRTPILHTLDGVAWECNLRSSGVGEKVKVLIYSQLWSDAQYLGSYYRIFGIVKRSLKYHRIFMSNVNATRGQPTAAFHSMIGFEIIRLIDSNYHKWIA